MTSNDPRTVDAGSLRQQLDAVGWEQRELYDLEGDTGEVPLLLHQLALPDSDARTTVLADRLISCGTLGGHYAVLRDATPIAVPFLVRLAQDPRTPERDVILDLLTCIAAAVEVGPEEDAFGESQDGWFHACGKALTSTNPTGWFTELDHEASDAERRRRVLRLLAIVNRFRAGELSGLLWNAVLDATDASTLADRLICLAAACGQPDTEWNIDWSELDLCYVWHTVDFTTHGTPTPRQWLRRDRRPTPEQTAETARTALDQLPAWLDQGAVIGLRELLDEELPIHR